MCTIRSIKFNACKSGAIFERITSNACNAVRDCNACKRRTATECIILNFCSTIRNNKISNYSTIQIQIMCIIQWIGISTSKIYATPSGNVVYMYFFKSGATFKCITFNACHAVRYCNACKGVAIIERIISNACNTVGYCNACKAGAT